jgi:Acyl-CoA reductase (LuxC)
MVNSIPVRAIIEAIGSAASAWSDASFPSRVRTREAVRVRTGYSPAVVDYALDRLFGSLTGAAMAAVIEDELGSIEVLDRFVARGVRHRVRAFPAGRVCVVSSRTTIGVGIIPALFALCAHCSVLVKDREDDLVCAFFATLEELLPKLRGIAVARRWLGESDLVELDRFDCVVAFGSDDTLDAIAATLHLPTRLIAYPSKASAGYVSKESLATETAAERIARAAARDLLFYDGEGCLSLNALFLERGANVSAERFCAILSEAIALAAREFSVAPAASVAMRLELAREVAAFRTVAGGAPVAQASGSFLVTLDDPPEEPPFFLPGALAVRSVNGLADAAAYLARHHVSLEALAVAGSGAAIAELATAMGASRIARFGRLQAPPLGAFHGGRPRIAEFVRWSVDET